MNCKFHPTAEAVTKCDVCGAELCSMCAKGAFYENDGKPVCLECSLKGAEEELELKKDTLKGEIRDGIIASVIWFAGLVLGGVGHEVFYILMLVAAIFHGRGALFTSEERGFFEKIKEIFWNVVLVTLFMPIFVIILLIRLKMEVIKANRKVKKIKATLSKANR